MTTHCWHQIQPEEKYFKYIWDTYQCCHCKKVFTQDMIPDPQMQEHGPHCPPILKMRDFPEEQCPANLERGSGAVGLQAPPSGETTKLSSGQTLEVRFKCQHPGCGRIFWGPIQDAKCPETFYHDKPRMT